MDEFFNESLYENIDYEIRNGFDFGTVEEFLDSNDHFCRVYFSQDPACGIYEINLDKETPTINVYDGISKKFDFVTEISYDDFRNRVGEHKLYACHLWQINWPNVGIHYEY